MRFWPDSIAGRTVGLLFAGLVFTATVSLSVFQLDFFHGKGWDETFRNLHRVAVIASIMNRVPPDTRPALLPALNERGLAVVWEPRATPPPLCQDGMTHHLARDIRVLAEAHGLERVAAGYPSGVPAAAGWLTPEPGPAEVWIALSDDTWLRFVIASEEKGRSRPGRHAGHVAVDPVLRSR